MEGLVNLWLNNGSLFLYLCLYAYRYADTQAHVFPKPISGNYTLHAIMYWFSSAIYFILKGVIILEGPSDFIVIPPATEAVFSCTLTEGALPSWRINGAFFSRIDPLPAGHALDRNDLNVTMPTNGSEYICVLTFLNGTSASSDPAFLYIAGMYIYLDTVAYLFHTFDMLKNKMS